jgi:hypothetical protein
LKGRPFDGTIYYRPMTLEALREKTGEFALFLDGLYTPEKPASW